MTDRLRLLPKHRRLLEALLQKHLPEVEVWAYGSRVNGCSHDGSDLDLVLRGLGLNKIPIDSLVDFEEAVRESTIPFLVEARDWARLPERFHREIERDYMVLRDTGENVDAFRAVPLGQVTERDSDYARTISCALKSHSLHSPNNAPSLISSVRWTTRSS